MTDLPAGWAWTTLGELGVYQNGRGFKKSEWAKSGRPIIRIQNLTGSRTSFNYFAGEVDPRHEVHPGDLLMSWAATLGVFFWDGPEAVLNQHIFKVQSHIDVKFHYYLLKATLSRLLEQTHGSGMVHITKTLFDRTPVPLPALDEQQQIVAAIEEQFSRLDAAGESIRQATLRLKGYLSSVIAYHIERAGWPRRALADLAILITDGDHRPPRRVPEGIPHLEAKHVKQGALVTDNCTYVSEEGFAQTRKRYDPRPGDVIVTCVGTLGEVAIVPEGLVFSAGRNLAAVRPMPELVTSEYLAYALNTPRSQRLLRRGSGSTAQPHLYLKDLRAVTIPVPDLGEQTRSVEQLDAQVSIGRDLERGLKAASSKALGIREAVLRDAFAGRFASAGSSSSVLSEAVTA